MKKSTIKKITISLSLAFVLTVLMGLVSFEANCEDIRNNVLRLHVLANSDTKTDQELKLKVRDAIIEKSGVEFDSCTNLETAMQISTKSLPDWQQTAKGVIKENGFNYDVNVSLKKSYFDTRVYEEFTLPAGYYNAVRIEIGEANGQNWWCVMFPSLCLSAASKDKASKYFDKEAAEIVTNSQKYEIRFKTIEIFEKIKKNIINRLK